MLSEALIDVFLNFFFLHVCNLNNKPIITENNQQMYRQ